MNQEKPIFVTEKIVSEWERGVSDCGREYTTRYVRVESGSWE